MAARLRAMLGAIGYAATDILGGEDWQAGIREFLARLGAASGVGRVTLFRVHRAADGRLSESCIFDWAAPGLPHISGDPRYHDMPLQDRPGGELDDWSRRRQRGEIVQALRRDTTGHTREVFEQHGTLSFISVPILVDGDWWGFIGFDDCEVERAWTEIEIDLLKAAAALIAGAIRRARMGERLRLSEERYALAARGANDGLFDWNIASDTVYLAPRVGEVLGCDSGALGTRIDDLFVLLDPEGGPSPAELLRRRFAAQGRKFELECRVRLAPGAAPADRWVVLRGLIVYAGGRPSRVVGSLRDISRRKQAEAGLSRARRQLHDAVEAISDGFVLYDADDRLVLYNSHYRELIENRGRVLEPGRTYEALLRDDVEAGFTPETARSIDDWVREKVALHRALRRDHVARGAGGRWLRINEYRTDDGGTVAIYSDITELKRREQSLKRSRRLLRSVIDAVPAVINVKDRDSRYLLMNRFQGEVYGVAPEAAIGRTSADLMGARYGEAMRLRDIAVMESGQPQYFIEHDFVDAAGRSRNWYTAKVPLFGESGGIEGVVTGALDITELKALERARANLARYVAPGMADLLAAMDEPFGPARQQSVAVMFADIVGFTRFAAEQPPEQVFALLRGFHARAAGAVFANHGTLDKYTGDGMMATFGTPSQGPRDASNALTCARAIRDAIADWNAARRAAGEAEVEVAIGLHYGPVLLGNIGDERRLEFAVIGDTVNVASRLEKLARPLAAGVVASGDLVDMARREGGTETEATLEGLEPRGPQPIRGRSRPIPVWILPRRAAPTRAVS
ncbi:MAG TPA: adenylate/guanylate cyclase domain-containing protein [Dongiaceae bacterium]|nr:adenylate/guanylate cyclase domain-containing protein [Dongiaceae bacterium]